MFQIGQLVIYGSHGVCRIVATEERIVDRKRINYLALEPVSQQGSRYLIPADNPRTLSKLKALMTRDELESLLASDIVRQDHWIADENNRKQRYKELISCGDRSALLGMIHALYKHKDTQFALGRKMHQCDQNFLNDAQKLLTEEFSLVLQIEPEKVGEYILSALSK